MESGALIRCCAPVMMISTLLWRLDSDKVHAAPQADITDNVPLHVLGGNIIPIALGSQFMLTQAVRNASHALVVAFPKANSTYAGSLSFACPVYFVVLFRHLRSPGNVHPVVEQGLSRDEQSHFNIPSRFCAVNAAGDRCGGRCGGAPQAGVLNACGHMYLDQGEELNLSRNLNNYLNLASQMVQQVLDYTTTQSQPELTHGFLKLFTMCYSRRNYWMTWRLQCDLCVCRQAVPTRVS